MVGWIEDGLLAGVCVYLMRVNICTIYHSNRGWGGAG